MEQNLELDSKQFLLKSLDRMLISADYAYSTGGSYYPERGHTTISILRSEISILREFVLALNVKE